MLAVAGCCFSSAGAAGGAGASGASGAGGAGAIVWAFPLHVCEASFCSRPRWRIYHAWWRLEIADRS